MQIRIRKLPRITVGQLRTWMEQNKISQAELAKHLGMRMLTVHLWLQQKDETKLLARNSLAVIVIALMSGLPGLINIRFVDIEHVRKLINGFTALDRSRKERTIQDAHLIAEARALAKQIAPDLELPENGVEGKDGTSSGS